MARPGNKTNALLPRPCLHRTRAIHGSSLVNNTSQRGCVIELTGQFPSQGRQPWATAGAGQPAFPFPSHLKHFAVSEPKVEMQFNVCGLID